jgi:urease gamma subunit
MTEPNPNLTDRRNDGMVFHMKTTLMIDDRIMTQLKAEAARQGKTISELVESALRLMLRKHEQETELPPIPTFKVGEMLVDVNDREKLYEAMEGR